MKLSYLKNINSFDELKREYRKLAFIFHPDYNGKISDMQKLNEEYKFLNDKLSPYYVTFKNYLHGTFWNDVPKCEVCDTYKRMDGKTETWYCETCEMNEWKNKFFVEQKLQDAPQCQCGNYKLQNRLGDWVCVYCEIENQLLKGARVSESEKIWRIRKRISSIKIEKMVHADMFHPNGQPKTEKRPERWDKNNNYINIAQWTCGDCSNNKVLIAKF